MFTRNFLLFCLVVLFLAVGDKQAVSSEVSISNEKTGAVTLMKENPGDIVEPAVSQEEAVKIARSVFPELLEGKDLQVQLDNYMGMGQRVWQVSWNSRYPSQVRQLQHVGITLDAQTGDLLNASFWMETGDSGSDTNLVSREEAMKKAEEFVKKIRPVEFNRTRLDPKQYPEYYGPTGTMKQIHSFNWRRFENGIAVEGDGITVGVDALTGQIQHYSLMWRGRAEFPVPGGVMEAGDIARRALGDLGLYLGYGVREDAGADPRGVPEAFLVYRLNGNSPYFDPQTGEPLDGTGKRIAPDKAKRFKQLPGPMAGSAGIDPPEASGAKISEIEGLKTAQDFFRKIGVGGTVTRSGSGSGGYGVFREESWSYSAQKGREDGMAPHMDPQVHVDIFTGEVSQYYNYNFRSYRESTSANDKPVLTREQALDKAKNFIKLVQPERLGKVTLVENMDWGIPGKMNEYNFEFVRLINGLPFSREGFDVSVDSANGEISRYSCRWHRASFPDPAKALQKEDAGKMFIEKVPYELVYFFPWQDGKRSAAPVLAYHFAGQREMELDAVSGQLMYSDWMASRPVNPDKPAVAREHWASLSLALLSESGLLPAGEGVDPDGAVTRRDAVRVLMGAMNKYYSGGEGEEAPAFSDIGHSDRDFETVQLAVRMGVLTGGGEFRPDEPLTRETMAAWLVRALGYEEVAKMTSKIELSVKDVEQVDVSLRNHVAIINGLGLMSGDDGGFFRPRDKLTWAELATVASKAAPRLRNKFGQW